MPRLTKEKWLTVQAEYENPSRSVLQLAKEYGVSEAAIRKKAKANNWQKYESESSNIIDEKVRTIKTLHELENRSSNLSEQHQDKINKEVAKRLELEGLYGEWETGLTKVGIKLVQNFNTKDDYAHSKFQSLTTSFKNMKPSQPQTVVNNNTQNNLFEEIADSQRTIQDDVHYS